MIKLAAGEFNRWETMNGPEMDREWKAREVEDAARKLEVIAELQKTEGWQLFLQVLEGTLHSAAYKIQEAKDPYEAWRHLAVQKTVSDLKSWTDREILVATQIIQQSKEK